MKGGDIMREFAGKRFLTVEEVKKVFNVHRLTVIRWIETGEIPAVKVANRWYIPESWLEKLEEKALARMKGGAKTCSGKN